MGHLNAKQLDFIRNQSISSAIAKHLEKLILSGEISPGDRINESQFAAQLGVSRAPIREACRQLEKYGMVEVRVGKGTYVRSIDLEEAIELYDVRISLEALAFEQAVNRKTREGIITLEEYIKKMEEDVNNKDFQSYIKNNLDFHYEIYSMSKNKNLISFLETITKKLTLFRVDILSQRGEMKKSLSEHKKILNYLKNSDVELGVIEIKNHVSKGRSKIISENNL